MQGHLYGELHVRSVYRRLAVLLAVTLAPGVAGAQESVVPLPSVAPQTGVFPGHMVSHPDSAAELPQPFFETPQYRQPAPPAPYRALPQAIVPNQVLPEACLEDPVCQLPLAPPRNPDLPPDARDGMFQKLLFTAAYIDPESTRDLGLIEMDLRMILALPIPSRKAPMLITPGFGTYFLQWPRTPDLPSQLYDAYVQFRWMYRWNPAIATDFAVTPGVYSDFEQGTDEAIRLPGHGALLWTWTPQWQALVGCAYLDRLENNILPIGGLIWTPNDDVKYEMVLPQPKLAHRVRWSGACTDDTQDWIYLAGEFGGSMWAVGRADGSTTRMDYRDWRLLLGIQRKAIGRLDYRFELGYVFDRRFLYDTSPVEYEPDDTFMVRIGTVY